MLKADISIVVGLNTSRQKINVKKDQKYNLLNKKCIMGNVDYSSK